MIKLPKISATIEARMSSKRLPGKVLLPLMGKPILLFIIDRLRLSSKIDEIIVATTTKNEDKVIQKYCEKWGVNCYAGSSENIISRLIGATSQIKTDVILQITGDNPFVDPKLIDLAIEIYNKNDFDYVCNHLPRTLPLGLEIKIFSRKTLLEVKKMAKNKVDKQHGSSFIYKNPEKFSIFNIYYNDSSQKDLRLTIDQPEDYETVINILSKVKTNFFIDDILKIVKNNPEVITNSMIKQKTLNEG